MKILIVSQYFWPENFIINAFAKKLLERKHGVTILTGKPNYPDGIVAPAYRGLRVIKEDYADGIKVFRVPLFPRGSASSARLVINYLSFVFFATWHAKRLFKAHQFDVIFVFGVSPITAALPAISIKGRLGGNLVLWVQDIWPDSLSATGHIKSKIVLKWVEKLVAYIYAKANLILVQSNAFVEPVRKLCADADIRYFPNFAPEQNDEQTNMTEQEIPKDLSDCMDNSFTIVFAGNLGKAQSLHVIVEAAECLRQFEEIKFIILGSGSMTNSLTIMLRDRKLDNVILAGRHDPALMHPIFQRADALLITLSDDKALNLTIPSKLQSYMKSARPILGALNGEAARQIIKSRAGFVVPAGDGQGLADMILKFKQMPPEDRHQMGMNAKAYFQKNFEINQSVDNFLDMITPQNNG